jgi:S1-C subfamily serine protease
LRAASAFFFSLSAGFATELPGTFQRLKSKNDRYEGYWRWVSCRKPRWDSASDFLSSLIIYNHLQSFAMYKTFLAVFVGVGTSLSIVSSAIALSSAEVNEIAKGVTVSLKSPTSSGSGVIIQKSGSTYTVLTAAHVLSSQIAYEVTTGDGQHYPLKANAIRRHAKDDVAIAQFSSSRSYRVATLGDPNLLEEGASIFVAGFPARTEALTESIYSFTKGEMTAKPSRPFKDGYGLVYTNTTLPGMSGGPVFNANGQLVGIHGRADAKAQLQDEQVNPKIYIKSGVNLGIPITALFALVPKTQFVLAPAVGISKRSAVKQNLIDDLMASSDFKRRQNDLPGAIAALDRAIQLDPNNVKVYNERGSLYLQSGNFLAAAVDFNQTVQIDPNFSEGYYNRGYAYYRSGSREEAIASYRKAAELFKAQGKTEQYKATQTELKSFYR